MYRPTDSNLEGGIGVGGHREGLVLSLYAHKAMRVASYRASLESKTCHTRSVGTAAERGIHMATAAINNNNKYKN